MIIKDYKKFLEDLLTLAVKKGASDIHLSSSKSPIFRIASNLIPLTKEAELKSDDIVSLVKILLSQDYSQERFDKFLREREIDFSYDSGDKGRFRGNAYFQQGKVSCALRFLSRNIMTIEELGLPPILNLFSEAHQGFVLITGPSSQGKSTTLAALIDSINHSRSCHIITIEDPIEYVFEDDLAIVDQREVYSDTLSFARALRSTFRQDPDVIMLGEMRDPETIATALSAAETGHLVFATLHTNSASQTIHRIVDSFEDNRQKQIRAQLSGSLLGIVSQRLIPRIKGGLIPATEIIFNNAAIANLIREGKIHEIPIVIETSSEEGMISLNKSLAILVQNKEITRESAFKFTINPDGLRTLLGEKF
ncbi:MAG: PilT/PilU family type 4a pilus ATPase [Candidatus Parcubacteria bacterium]|nr:PilT/PilU family type 4a pilus ATPase [Candidatus Parcubacteria bacterium]